MREVWPVILAGGVGERLWPVSRRLYPKPFIPLRGRLSPFRQACRRLRGHIMRPPMVLASNSADHIVREDLRAEGLLGRARLILEPNPLGTAVAAASAALIAIETRPDIPLLLMPADQHMDRPEAFMSAVQQALPSVQDKQIVLFGIQPQEPETQFGYIELAEIPDGSAAKVIRFVEKPDRKTAAELIKSGKALWNAGIVLSRADVLLQAFRIHAPQLLAIARHGLALARRDGIGIRLAPVYVHGFKPVSLDRAILEKARDLRCMAVDCGWHDLGSWSTLRKAERSNAQGNVLHGDVEVHGVFDSIVWNHGGPLLAVAGLQNIVAVSTPDAVLLSHGERPEDVALLARKLAAQRRAQAFRPAHVSRPWGMETILGEGLGFIIKQLVIRPGASLSLQTHRFRSETWMIAQGKVRATIGDDVLTLLPGHTAHIPKQVRHRLENPTSHTAIVIELQLGDRLEDNDIIRHEDVYGRASPMLEDL
ncbi:mannose-1-phosphate guanylyltransferase/mannose-6-phosphate isomerase [Thermopetrobacter sp. TC1]|uniref:mannose-1-phosphate guanylyltransferase/mannose-6-phosphate isomerase n=1 Tax=Thermopetrobacter sp. TC1 TaxID=1495045 RepID=UPI0009DDCC62|nr:mannose-1-phosphate guanylyltransferase/mannose-6-phosphate isomerase [Thermopetrobacter sp. TC1]